jgi:hypothetical protein
MRNIYGKDIAQTSVAEHMRCGWKGDSRSSSDAVKKDLPVFVLSIGLEGAGHHLYSELFAKPVFDCVWVNTRLSCDDASWSCE